MERSKSRFILLFARIIFPIIFIVTISAYFLYIKAENDKKAIIYEKVEIISKLISSIYQFDEKLLKTDNVDFNTKTAVLLQVQKAFDSLKDNDQVFFEYLLAEKTSSHIEFLAYTSDIKPPSIKLSDIHLAVPMRKALNNVRGAEIKNDYHQNKVFSAFTKIDNTPWGLVIKQPYQDHIAPFKEAAYYSAIVLSFMLVFIYFLLKYYELKNSSLIKKEEDRFQQLVESTDDWVWEIDINGCYRYVSKQVEKMLGYKPDELLGRTPFIFMHREESIRVSSLFKILVENSEKMQNIENMNIHKNGHTVFLLTSGSPFFDSKGKIQGYRGICKDITNLKSKEKELKQLAYYDTLTSLANRKTISMRIDEEIKFALRSATNSALIFMDLDGFKHINDSLGHNHGDKVLKTIAKRLLKTIREFDVASRVGGDEFILLIRGKERGCEECREHLVALIKRIILAINEPLEIDGKINHVGASLGVVLIPADGDNATEIIKRADSAMYKAKELGKNRAVFYNTALQDEADKFLQIKSDLLNAFKNREFIMYYQAQFNANDTEKIVGYEALIRWQHPTRGMVPPSKFLPFIEKLGLSIQLDKYVYSKVQDDIQNQILNDNNLHISINLSAISFEDDIFIEFIENKITLGSIDTSRIILEITEETLIKNIESSFIQKIKSLGFKISIDDFGTGYSSLAYLSSIEFDEIKLDMSFVQAIHKSEKDAQICKFILNMSQALGVNVVAEGVETQKQLDFVREGGANIIQGYLLAKPDSVENIF